jgi:membrane-associated protease RseP (regulator of RpoE activity)
VEKGGGVLVLEVIDESPADIAGLQAGDVILEIDGRKMTSTDELVSYVGKSEPGEDVDITYKRKRRTRTVEVELGKKDGPAGMFGEMLPGMGKCDMKCMTKSDTKCHTEPGKSHCWIGEGPGCKVKVMELPGGKGHKWIQIGVDPDDLEGMKILKDLDLDDLEDLDLEDMKGDMKIYHMDMDDLHEELEHLRDEIEELKEEIKGLKE